MAVDERGRLQLADAAKRAFGDDAGITLMELLPPVGWADVATKQDVLALEARMDARFTPRFEALETRIGKVEEKVDELVSSARTAGITTLVGHSLAESRHVHRMLRRLGPTTTDCSGYECTMHVSLDSPAEALAG